MAKKLTDDELQALVNSEMRQSLGYNSSKLTQARQKAMYYYLGQPIADLAPPEIDGRSKVVSTDVRNTIEAMLPQLMVTFCGGDSVAEFEATLPDDEPKANLATEYVNYLFFKKNNGHKISYQWMKDALLQKNGIVKVWWDTRHEETKEEYSGLDEIELAQLLDDDEIEVIEQNSYPDEEDQEQRDQAIQQLSQQLQQAQQGAQMGSPQAQQAVQALTQQIQGIQAQPPKFCFDVVCKRVKKDGKITIENVPPEEFLIARNAKDIQTARFVAHRVQRTKSELASMGYKNLDQISGEDQAQAVNMERITRLAVNDENAFLSDMVSGDDSQTYIWLTEAYVRVDADGDGIAELRKITVAGNQMLDNEEVDYIPFVSITPVPLPHTFFGLSVADLAMESQLTNTSILRARLDNLYLDINGRYFAVEGQVNLDDLLTSRPGGVVRVKQPGAVGRLDQGTGNIADASNLMEFLQMDLENRTGWSRQSMGNDASGLRTTATAANIVTNKADMRLDLIARNFAEGFTDLFKLILKLVCQHQNKGVEVKLSGGWVSIDPREWRNQFDVSINVGIGMGNKDQKVQHMLMLMQHQAQTFQLGVANPKTVYEASAEFAKLLGYKNPEKFFSDPAKNQQPQKPDPEMVKMQGQMQLKQAELQFTAQQDQMRLQQEARFDELRRQHELQLEQAKMQMQAQVDTNRQEAEARQKALEAQQQAQLDQLRAQMEQERHAQELEFQRWKATLDAETKVLVAQIAAASKEVESPAEQIAEGGAEEPSTNSALAAAINGFTAALGQLQRPKQVVRGPDGRVTGII